MSLPERATAGSRRVGWWSLLGLVLVPLLVAGGFLWATWDSTDRLDRVQAAVVNLDEPVTLQGQPVPLGRQLAGGLVSGGSGEDHVDTNFSWLLTDADAAAAGLADGRYAAVVTIPESFSADATSYGRDGGLAATPATLQVQTSEAGGLADAVIGQAITAAATSTLSSTLTTEYLKNVYVGFNDLGKQFQTVADAAATLSDGSAGLSDGLDQTADGTVALSDGLDQLADGVSQTADGADQLATGTSGLADGLDQLADGVAELPSGARTLADGTADSAAGATQLAAGADRLADGVEQLATGASGLSDGVAQYTDGLAGLAAGVTQYTGGVQQFADGLTTYRDTVAGIAGLSDEALVAAYPQLCPAPATVAECAPVLQGFRGGVTTALAGFENTTDPQTGATVPGLIPSGQALVAGGTTLAAGATLLGDSGPALATGASGLAAGVTQLSSGARELATGTDALADGLGQLADGTDQLADGLPALASGARSSADGAGELATGVRGLADGLGQLADGARQSADGAVDLAGGVQQLADGQSELADGTQQLAAGLQKGADAIPTYSSSTREKLADVVAQPVQTPRPTSAFSNVTTTTFLAVIALWVGALASFLVLSAVASGVLGSAKPSWRVALDGLLPAAAIGAVQALALTGVLSPLLDLSAGRTVELAGFTVLVALAFAALNHALVAWFGGVGRFVSVALVVLAAAGALTSAVPAGFAALQAFLPLTPALEGLRAVVTGADGVGAAVGGLLGWLLVGLAAGVLAVTRRRVVSAPLVAVPAHA